MNHVTTPVQWSGNHVTCGCKPIGRFVSAVYVIRSNGHRPWRSNLIIRRNISVYEMSAARWRWSLLNRPATFMLMYRYEQTLRVFVLSHMKARDLLEHSRSSDTPLTIRRGKWMKTRAVIITKVLCLVPIQMFQCYIILQRQPQTSGMSASHKHFLPIFFHIFCFHFFFRK